MQGVMIWTDGRGQLVIDMPGTKKAATALVQGENILRLDGKFSWQERFSEYIVRARRAASRTARAALPTRW